MPFGRFVVLAGVALGGAPRLAAQAADSVSPAVKVTGYLQPRLQATHDTASFLLRRARFAVEGRINPWATFRAQVEMRTIGAPATPPASPLTLSATDLLVRVSHERWTGTVGQFRVPFSLESLLSSTTLETTERSRVVNVARRDIGVQAEWRVPGRVTLQAAVVNGEGTNRAVNSDDRMAYFARAMLSLVQGLEVGGAVAAYSDSTGADAQAHYRGPRWTARAEYLRVRNRRTGVVARGWYALGAYVGIPRRLQLVGRTEQFDPSDQVATDRSTGYTVGLQYFVKGDDFKIVADYEVFREQVGQLANDRFVVQTQVRW